MISLELAKKLKEAGLEWKPKEGDWGFNDGWEMPQPALLRHNIKVEPAIGDVWLPRLDQLLDEIEKRGYEWNNSYLKKAIGKKYTLLLFYDPLHMTHSYFEADTPEEAAGQALLWILEREKEANPVG